jgi:hypothetical protein
MPTGERAKGVPLTMTFGSTMSGIPSDRGRRSIRSEPCQYYVYYMSILRRPPDIWPRVGMAVTASPHTEPPWCLGDPLHAAPVPRLDVRVLPSTLAARTDISVPRPLNGVTATSQRDEKKPVDLLVVCRRHPPPSPCIHLRDQRQGRPGIRSPLKIDS